MPTDDATTSAEVEAHITELIARYSADQVNLAEMLCDAHVAGDAPAMLYEDSTGSRTVTYAELRQRSAGLAGALEGIGVTAGDRVAVLLPRSPDLVASLLAIWRLGAVHVPMFTAFGPDAVQYRVAHSGARVLITDADNRPKLQARPDALEAIICAGIRPGSTDVEFEDAVAGGDTAPAITVGGADPFIILYTSGTTGKAKGVVVPVRALASIHAYMHYGLDLRAADVFWNISDPGWGYGLWYGIVGALLFGQRMLLRNVRFDPVDTFEALARHGITNLAGSPTAFRALGRVEKPRDFARSNRLRVISSAGEPLNAELLAWSREVLGTPIHDHYGQSEIGMVAGFPHHPALAHTPQPCSMGSSLPGYRMIVLRDDGLEALPGEQGDLTVDIEGSPLYWFSGYYRDPKRSAERFPYGRRLYVTGDAASAQNGMLHFASRVDDVITSSGYRIGPYDVESALMAHPAVAEAAVVGTPDELRGEAVTAFIVTAPTAADTDGLPDELREFVRSRLAAHLYPRHIVFIDALPRTPSGKVQRALLRACWDDERIA